MAIGTCLEMHAFEAVADVADRGQLWNIRFACIFHKHSE